MFVRIKLSSKRVVYIERAEHAREREKLWRQRIQRLVVIVVRGGGWTGTMMGGSSWLSAAQSHEVAGRLDDFISPGYFSRWDNSSQVTYAFRLPNVTKHDT